MLNPSAMKREFVNNCASRTNTKQKQQYVLSHWLPAKQTMAY